MFSSPIPGKMENCLFTQTQYELVCGTTSSHAVWSFRLEVTFLRTCLSPQETLLHFSARRGLSRVTRFLLRQHGARDALQLVNKEGHTPSAIAALRGHEHLHELLTKTETDAETNEASETLQLVSAECRVCCNSPTLNTHTLTVSICPGHSVPTLQESVGYLLHLLSHLHAKGLSELELQLDSLHTAAECRDGVKTNLTCQKQLQQPASTSECLLTETEGSEGESIKGKSGSIVVWELDETCNLEKKENVPLVSEIPLQQHSLDLQEDGVCLGSNSNGESCQTDGRVDSSLNLCDRSERAQGEAEGEIVTVGNVPAEGCCKQAEETDTAEAVIREEQEAEKEEEQSEQEAGDVTATGKEEESISELTVLTSASRDTQSTVMGQSPLSGSSEFLNTHESETKLKSLEGENIEKEHTELTQEFFDGSNPDEEKAGREELTDPVSTPRDLPNPPLIVCGDVIEQRESAVPRVLIEGLHDGEPPPDINSHEQNQETAGRDYAAEQEGGSASEAVCHSGNRAGAVSNDELDDKDTSEPRSVASGEPENAEFQIADDSIEETWIDQLNSEPSLGSILAKRKTDLDSGVVHRISSDEEGSFKSFGSSSTEIFHATQDNGTIEEGDLLQAMTAEMSLTGCTEDPNNLKPSESHKHSLGEDTELSLDPVIVSSLNPSEGGRDGTEPESQMSASLPTMEGLNHEDGEELLTELSEQGSGLDPIISVREDAPTVKADEGDIRENSISSDVNIEIEHDASELSATIQSESSLSGGEENKIDGPVEDDQQMDTNDKLEAAEESGNVQMQPEQGDSKTVDMASAENQLAVSLSQDPDPQSDTVDVSLLDLEPHASIAEVSMDPRVEDQMTDDPNAGDAVDGALALESCTAADRGGKH
ncbi:hypothetical protein XENORESO_008794 [Xenotaenia resolanae]|uniref:Uncharacterized protein n=1 Tax=Xenotaenia resolanae TaxID=208358 RepID=A0ABV0X7Q1_9TELE